MRRPAIFVAALSLLLLGTSCDHWPGIAGSGVAATEERLVPEFHTIRARGAMDLSVVQGPATSVVVTVDDNLMPHLETTVSGGVLELGFDVTVDPRVSPRAEISLPVLQGVHLSGSGNVQVQGGTTPSFAASLSGSGNIRIEGVHSPSFEARISGSGNVSASGSADHVELRISGSGDMDLQRLVARTAEARISGSGTIRLHVEEHLGGAISGSGDVLYDGSPRCTLSVSGSGSVRHL